MLSQYILEVSVSTSRCPGSLCPRMINLALKQEQQIIQTCEKEIIFIGHKKLSIIDLIPVWQKKKFLPTFICAMIDWVQSLKVP